MRNHSSKSPSTSPPIVSFSEEPAGPKTLAAIAEDRAQVFHPYAHRGPARTKHYGDRISNAPGAVSPSSARALDDAPELTVRTYEPGRATLALIEEPIVSDGPEITVEPYRPGLQTFALIEEDARTAGPEVEVRAEAHADLDEFLNLAALEIEEVHTFVIACRAEYFRSETQRRKLLEGRLLAKIPGLRLSQVSRMEVKRAGTHRTVVRVYARDGH